MDTKYGDISRDTAGFWTGKLLERGQHGMVTERFGSIDPQGQNKSDTRKWTRYHSLPRAVAPLAEGIAPGGQRLTKEVVTATLDQYGDLVWITDKVADLHEDPVMDEATKLIGEQSAETIEAIRISYLKGGSNVTYANGVASRSLVTSCVLQNDLRRIHRAMKKNKAREISEIIPATAMVSTEPVAASYFAMGSTDLLSDLKNLDGWNPLENYSQVTKGLDHEYGKCEEFRFILTPMFEPWEAAGVAGTTYLSSGAKVSDNTACDVYPIIIVARDSYAIVPLQGKKAVKISVQNPGKISVDNPLGQKGFVSWMTWQGGAILNHLWVMRYEVAATAL